MGWGVSNSAGKSRLTAILMADAVGYSRGMSGRERETLAELVACRQLMTEVVGDMGGRVVGIQGDSFLAELPSGTDAVIAAIRIQEAVASRHQGRAPDALVYRIGINLGDVYDVDGDIHGDGVNIAARLQALAEPGGILVSGAVHDLVRDRIPVDFVFSGEHALKNITGRVRAYRAVPRGDRRSSFGPRAKTEPDTGYERPSIEIRRFKILGGGRSARKACDMITDELTSMLSSISGILLIRGDLATASNDRAETGSGPHRYLLTGTGSATDGRFKLSTQLVLAQTGRVVWSDRNELELDRTFKVPDKIAREVTTALQVTLTEGEAARLWNSGTADTQAWELYQRGREKFREVNRSGHREAERLFRIALACDPSYLAASVSLGYAMMDAIRYGWNTSPDSTWPALLSLHRRALQLGPSYPDTHGLGAYILVLQRRYDEAIATMRHAVSLSRGDSVLTALLGLIYAYAGRVEDAVLCYEQAVRMNPYAPLWLRHNLAMAYRRTRRLDDALIGFHEVLKRDPGFVRSLVGLVSVQSRLGQLDDARNTANEVMRLDPLFLVDEWAARQPTADEALMAEIKDDLRKAGLK